MNKIKDKRIGLAISLFIILVLSNNILEEATASSEGEGFSYYVASDSFFSQYFEININLISSEVETDELSIELLNPDILVQENPVDFEFRVTHNSNSTLVCDVLIDDESFTGLTVNQNTASNSSFLLNDGGHNWNVDCSTENQSESMPGYFNVDLPFEISTDKDVYRVGEDITLEILAPEGSAVDLVMPITGSTWTWFNHIEETYPHNIDILDKISVFGLDNLEEGTYEISAELDYLPEPVTFSTSFVVTEPVLDLRLVSNVSNIDIGESVLFTATVTNATGSINYNIDFGDGDSSSSDTTDNQYSVSHVFETEGTYYVNMTVINDGKITSSGVSVDVDEPDTTNPVIELISPTHEKTFSSNAVTLKYRAYDKTTMKCYVYLTKYIDSAWGSKELEDAETGVNNGSLKSTTITGLSDGKYSWEVNCTDAADLSTVSGSRQFIISTDPNNPVEISEETVEASEEESESDSSPETDEIIGKIEKAIKDFQGFGEDKKEALNELGLSRFLDDSKKELKRIARDLNNIKFRKDLDEDGKENRKQELIQRMVDIEANIPVGLTILNSKEYVKYDIKSDIGEILSKYLEFKEFVLSDSQKEKFVEKIKEIQSLMTVSTETKNIEVEYIGGNKETFTLIHKTIQLDNDSSSIMIEVIPKDIAEKVSDITFLGPIIVVEEDPIVEIDLAENKELLYYVKKNVDLQSIEDIDSILLSDPSDISEDVGFITGLAVFGKDTFTGFSFKWLIIVFAIILLAGVYFFYGRASTPNISFDWLNNSFYSFLGVIPRSSAPVVF